MQYNRQGKIKVPPYVAFIVLAGMLIWYVSGGLTVSHNNAALANAVKVIPEDVTEVNLNEIVPFEWGAVYTFEPYTTKSEIMEITGLTAGTIAETTSEGQVQLLFVSADGKEIAASVCGDPSSVGYNVSFPQSAWDGKYAKLTPADNAAFAVSHEDGVVVLTGEQ